MEHKPPLDPGLHFHVYNRGNNKSTIFRDADDFRHFIMLMRVFLTPVAEVYSYALMRNHYHFALSIKQDEKIGWLIPENQFEQDVRLKWSVTFGEALSSSPRRKPNPQSMLRHLFSSYSKWHNNRHGRSGKIFEERFERKLMHSESQMRRLIIYINRNPQKHQVVPSYKEYPWTSYHELMSEEPTWLARTEVIQLFHDKETLIKALDWSRTEEDFEDL